MPPGLSERLGADCPEPAESVEGAEPIEPAATHVEPVAQKLTPSVQPDAVELFQVGVRNLCEFGARSGSLELRSAPAPTALEGMAGHQAVVSGRGAHYEAELALSADYRLDADTELADGRTPLILQVRGRADGFDAALNRLEEIKTHRGQAEGIPDGQRALHWAQARVYGHLLCLQRDLPGLELALVYYNVDSGEQTVLLETAQADALQQHFEALCERYARWARQELIHRQRRDTALADLAFPHPQFRDGQKLLARAVYNAHRRSCALLAQAPTGIGKSLATLFPALKASTGQHIDKIFFLTAKTPGRAVALDAWRQIGAQNRTVPLRVLELVAREKACEHPDRLCHGDSCPLARGYHDRLPQARAQAVSQAETEGAIVLDKARLREAALAHQICPYYFGQEMIRWSDLVVGDYNHYFDAGGSLAALAAANDWRVSVLVDEVHNLVDRARAMYTASISRSMFEGSAPSAALRRAGLRICTLLDTLGVGMEAPYQTLAEVPRGFVEALQAYTVAMGDYLARTPPAGRTRADDQQKERFFAALQFCRIADTFAEHSVCDLTAAPGPAGSLLDSTELTICIRNIVPAPFLRPRLEAAHSTTLFSATVEPARYLIDMLGLPESSVHIDVPAPFSPEQLNLKLVTNIPTRWARRKASIAPIVRLMVDQYRAHPGNYMLYASSFDYLAQIAQAFRQACPDIEVLEQLRSMTEAEREAFVAGFRDDTRRVGFAVLGGAFAEGVDLPGRRLIGAFVVTLGMPRPDPVTEVFRQRCEDLYGAGFEYAYLYPGMQRVIQAAGRVIRTPEDEGYLFLIDERIGRAAIRQLLPLWWQRESSE